MVHLSGMRVKNESNLHLISENITPGLKAKPFPFGVLASCCSFCKGCRSQFSEFIVSQILGGASEHLSTWTRYGPSREHKGPQGDEM